MTQYNEVECLAEALMAADDITDSMVGEIAVTAIEDLPGDRPEAELMVEFRIHSAGQLLLGRTVDTEAASDHKAVAVWLLTQTPEQ